MNVEHTHYGLLIIYFQRCIFLNFITEIHLNISKIGRLAPSYLRLQCFGLPLGGASIAAGVDYVNELVRRFPNVRQAAAVELRSFRKALGGLKLFHL